MPTSSLVAVTGANGYLGFHIVRQLLAAGQNTRAVVRSHSSGKRLSALFSDDVSAGRLSFAYVPDIVSNEHVYDDAFANATAVIHAASPIFSLTQKSDDPDKDFYQPAIHGALNAVKAAHRSAGVRRFVLTGSIVARYPSDRTFGPSYPRNEISPVSHADAVKLTAPQLMYRASKALSERAVWDWVKESKPQFSVTVLLPALFAGPYADPEAEHKTGSNSIYVAWTKNPKGVLAGKMSMTAADVQDVAKAHVNAALSHDAALANESFFVVQRTLRAVEVLQAVQQAVPSWTESWDAETLALISKVAGEEPDEQSRGIIAVSQEQDTKTLGIAPMKDSIETLKTLFKAVEAQASSSSKRNL